jgi:hypothetical protein
MQSGPISQNQDKPVSCPEIGVLMKLKHHQVEDFKNGCGYAVIAEFIWNLPKDQRIEAYKILATQQIFPSNFLDENFINNFESYLEIFKNPGDKNSFSQMISLSDVSKFVYEDEVIKEEPKVENPVFKAIDNFFSSLTSVGLTENQIFQRYFIEQFINSLSQKTKEGLTQNDKYRYVFDHQRLTQKFPHQQFSSQLESNYIDQDTIYKLFNGLFGDQYGFGFNETQEEIFSANQRMSLLLNKVKEQLSDSPDLISESLTTIPEGEDDIIKIFDRLILAFGLSFLKTQHTLNWEAFSIFYENQNFESELDSAKQKLMASMDEFTNIGTSNIYPESSAFQTDIQKTIKFNKIKIANYLKFFFQNFYSHQQQLLNLDNSYFLQVVMETSEDQAGNQSNHFNLYLPEKQIDQLPTLNFSKNLYLEDHQKKAIEQTFEQLNKNLGIITSSNSDQLIDTQEIEITDFRPAIYHDRNARKDDNFRYFQEKTLFSSDDYDQLQENTKASPLELIFKAINDANCENISVNQLSPDQSSTEILNEDEIALAIFLAKKFGGIGTRYHDVKNYLQQNLPEDYSEALASPDQADKKITELLAKLKKFSRQFQDKSKEAGIYSGNQNLTSEQAKEYGLRLAFVPDEIFINKVNKIKNSSLKELIIKDLNQKIEENTKPRTVVNSPQSLEIASSVALNLSQ